MYQITRFTQEIPVKDFLERYVNVEKTLSACVQCPNYGKRWSCPPYDFDPLTLWRKYQTIYLQCVQVRYDPSVAGRPLSSQELEHIMMQSLNREKRQLRERLEAKHSTLPGSMVLSAGCCALCEHCAREQGKPCRNPGHMHFSIESLGGDVEALTKGLFHLNILWMKDNCLPDYLTAVGAILLP